MQQGSAVSQPPAASEARYQGKTAAEWLPVLRDRDAATRRQAAAAVSAILPDTSAEVRPALEPLLLDDDLEMRMYAAIGLSKLTADPNVAQCLVDLLGQASLPRRSQLFLNRTIMLDAIVREGKAAKATLPKLRAIYAAEVRNDDGPTTEPLVEPPPGAGLAGFSRYQHAKYVLAIKHAITAIEAS